MNGGARGMAVVVLGVLLARAAVAAGEGFDPARAAVFTPENATSLARTCSRKSPGPVEGTWMPDPSQIRALEVGLVPVFYEAARAEGGSLKAGAYTRQYAGLIIGGRKIIYVNASALMRDPSEDDPPFLRKRMNWHEHAFSACDDGRSSFGVEYDVQAGTFRNFEFDGCMCITVDPKGERK